MTQLVVATFFAAYLAEAYTTDIRIGTFAKQVSMLLVLVGLVLLFIAAGWKILLAGLAGELVGLIVFRQWWSKRPLVFRHRPLRPDAYFETGVEFIELAERQQEARFKPHGVTWNLLKATENFDAAIRLDPSDFEAYYNRGTSYSRLGKHQKAIESYDQAIRLDPLFADTYNNRGIAYDKLGQYERAIQDFDEVIRLDPQDAKAYFNRAIVYDYLGKHVESERDIRKAKELGYPP